MQLRNVLGVFVLCLAAPFAEALDLTYPDRKPLPPEALADQLCRPDFKVCWVAWNGKRVVTKDMRERFFGPTNTVLWSLSAAVITLDGRSTLPNLGKTVIVTERQPDGSLIEVERVSVEKNRFLRPLVKHPVAFYMVESAAHLGVTAACWELRRKDRSSFVGKVVWAMGYLGPVVLDVMQFRASKRNSALARTHDRTNAAHSQGP